MASLPLKLAASLIALAFVFAAAPADAAKARKHKKPVAVHAATVAVKTGYRGVNLFPGRPVYNANDYLGEIPTRSFVCSFSAI